jgi:hypothetical protein
MSNLVVVTVILDCDYNYNYFVATERNCMSSQSEMSLAA